MMQAPRKLPRRTLLAAVLAATGALAQPAVAQTQAQTQAQSLYVVVSAKSPRTALTRKELLALYTGRVRTLGDGSPATPLDQRSDGDVREAFYRALTGMDIARINSYWARLHFTGQVQPPAAIGDDSDVIRKLLSDPLAVGYLTQKPADASLRVVLNLALADQD